MPRRLALVLAPLAASLALSACADDDFNNDRPANDLSVETVKPDLSKPRDLSTPYDFTQPSDGGQTD